MPKTLTSLLMAIAIVNLLSSCLATRKINSNSSDNKTIEISIALPKERNTHVFADDMMYNKIDKYPLQRILYDQGENSCFDVVIKNISKDKIRLYKNLAFQFQDRHEGVLQIFYSEKDEIWNKVECKKHNSEIAGICPMSFYIYCVLEPDESFVVRVYFIKYYDNFPKTETHREFKMKVKLQVTEEDISLPKRMYTSNDYPFWTGTVESNEIEVKLVNSQ